MNIRPIKMEFDNLLWFFFFSKPKELKEIFWGRKLLVFYPRLMIILIIGTNVVFCRKVNLCITQQVFHLAQGCAPDIVPEGERCLLNQKFLSFPPNMSIRTFIIGHCIHMENFLQQNGRVRKDLQISRWLSPESGNTAGAVTCGLQVEASSP